jgi:lysine-ketoglutarate reductase/saccharopine dehydrogenase-like protein (TIGR00300 family)
VATEMVGLEGHILDSLLLAKVLDLIVDAGAEYAIDDFNVGRTATDTSSVRLTVTGDDLDALFEVLQVHGVNRLHQGDAHVEAAERDGVLPVDFYSSTNLETEVRVDGRWVPVSNPEMDCALVIERAGPGAAAGAPVASARTVPMHRVRIGDPVVVGHDGVRVHVPLPAAGSRSFSFMGSDVSSEKPKALLVAQVADRLRAARQAGTKVLAVCGPAVIHTGGGPDLARMVAAGWIDVLFAGNGFATHDIECQVLGTSLGVSVSSGAPTEGGHSNHLRVINEVRRHGSIAGAVAAGYIPGGVMAACVARGVPFLLAGSVRDDGPLPDVVTDMVAAADGMRALIPGVSVALMLASTLHAVATGNILPASVEIFCVDINQAVATKLTDRGSQQAMGIVTDVGPFLTQLAGTLGVGAERP